MPTSNFYNEMVKRSTEQQELEKLLKAAWIEYDTTVDGITSNKRKHLEQISKKHGVSHLDVLEWYHSQTEDVVRH